MAILAGVAHVTRQQHGASMPMNIANEGVEAARKGCTVIGALNDKTGLGTDTILTDATLVYNVREGERVMIAGIAWGVGTADDTARAEIGYTSAANGAGSFTTLSSQRRSHTGPATTVYITHTEVFPFPRVASYKAGARSVTFRVTANDANCAVELEWSGWIEKEY